MAIEIFWCSGSPYAWRVLLTAEMKGIPYRSHPLQFSRKEHKAAEYLAINPRGEVPTLRDGPLVVTESLAIMVYLDRRFPDPPLFGADAEQAAAIWTWISLALYHLEPLSDRMVVPIFERSVAQSAADMQNAARSLHKEWARLEQGLKNQPFLASGGPGAADIVIYTYVAFLLRIVAREIAEPLELGFHPLEARYPSLHAWRQRIEQIPAYDRAYPPHWRSEAAPPSAKSRT